MSPDVHARLNRRKAVYAELRAALGFLVTLAVTAGVLAMALLAIQINKVTVSTNENSATLINCTTPRHACYERTRAETGKAVNDIGRVVVAAAYCAQHLPGATLAQVEACVRAAIS